MYIQNYLVFLLLHRIEREIRKKLKKRPNKNTRKGMVKNRRTRGAVDRKRKSNAKGLKTLND
jgi:hypothetical protein